MIRPRHRGIDLAEAAGVSQGFISRVLSGDCPASRKVRDAAVALFGLSEEILFGDRLDDQAAS